MNNAVIFCEHLARSYTDGAATISVLKDMNLEVAKGEMVAIVGSSGSGKSTFLQLLGGLDKPTSGNVLIHGQNIHALSEAKKCRLRNQHLGFIYQFHHLLPEFSALENVALPLLLNSVHPSEAAGRAEQLLNQVGLNERLGHRLSQLSGGERQRVAIARALVANPLCVLADEPTGNLDPKNAERVLSLFFDLQKSHQTSVVMVTHDPGIAKQAQRTLRISDGCLVDVM